MGSALTLWLPRVLALLCWIGAAMGDILVCPQCGYEYAPDAGRCAHCNAELPRPEPAAGSPVAEADGGGSDPRLKALNPRAVEQELRTVGEQLAAGDAEVALLLLRNATALNLLTDPAGAEGRSGRIGELRGEIDARVRTVRRKCPVCDGTGKTVMQAPSLTRERELQEVPGATCPECRGDGWVVAAVMLDERKYVRQQALARYAGLQRLRRFTQVGGAWAPPGEADRLSVRQRVQLKRAAASPCARCLGFGLADCRECHGKGEAPCSARGCVGGWIETESAGGLSGDRIKRREKCRACRGRGVEPCGNCGGRGAVLCAACGGSGERAACRGCGGEGARTCRKCRGLGTHRETPCAECRGEGVVECASCNGDGAGK